MPPPDGPFFSFKPLLYYGEEPLSDKVDNTDAFSSLDYYEQPPAPVWEGYSNQGYPGYYAPPPLGLSGKELPLPQMRAYPQMMGGQLPYYRYNPNYSGYPQFPVSGGTGPR